VLVEEFTSNVPTSKLAFYGVSGELLAECGVSYQWNQNTPSDIALGSCTSRKYLAGQRIDEARDMRDSKWQTSDAERKYPYGEMANYTQDDHFATYRRSGFAMPVDYARNRAYSAGDGRFTSPDPYEASGSSSSPLSWNRFNYVDSDPINRTDPSGLEWRMICIVRRDETGEPKTLCGYYWYGSNVPSPAPISVGTTLIIPGGGNFGNGTTPSPHKMRDAIEQEFHKCNAQASARRNDAYAESQLDRRPADDYVSTGLYNGMASTFGAIAGLGCQAFTQGVGATASQWGQASAAGNPIWTGFGLVVSVGAARWQYGQAVHQWNISVAQRNDPGTGLPYTVQSALDRVNSIEQAYRSASQDCAVDFQQNKNEFQNIWGSNSWATYQTVRP
jgi:RHS repeat-associated protein